MAVSLRLQRHGKKKRPFYRVVAADQRHPRDGRYTEALGTYDPNHDPIVVDLNLERVEYWLSVGAKPSDTVSNLIDKVRANKTVSPAQMLEANRKALAERRRAAAERAVAKEVRAEDQKVEDAPKAEEAAEAAAEAPAEEAAEAAPAEAAAEAPAEAAEAAPAEDEKA